MLELQKPFTVKTFTISPDLKVTKGIAVSLDDNGKLVLNLGGKKRMPIFQGDIDDVASGRVSNLHAWIKEGKFLELYRQDTDPAKMAKSDAHGILVKVQEPGFLKEPNLGKRQWLQNTHKMGGNEALILMRFNDDGVLAFQAGDRHFVASNQHAGVLVAMDGQAYNKMARAAIKKAEPSQALTQQIHKVCQERANQSAKSASKKEVGDAELKKVA